MSSNKNNLSDCLIRTSSYKQSSRKTVTFTNFDSYKNQKEFPNRTMYLQTSCSLKDDLTPSNFKSHKRYV